MDYLELTKPELTLLSVLTALCGFYMATEGRFDIWLFVAVGSGTAFLGGGVGALNQYIERKYDSLMKRTENRPLPSGRLEPQDVLIFGITMSLAGILLLFASTNVLTGMIALITFISYIFIYTPLKRVTALSTLAGGIPGALPPVIGWAAIRNDLSIEAWILFAIIFCWQMPHFYSLAWLYRKDYGRAGFAMLSVGDDGGKKTAMQSTLFAVALIPVTLASTWMGVTGTAYLLGAILLGATFLSFAVAFLRHSLRGGDQDIPAMNLASRKLFFSSLAYLPLLMILMCADKI